LVAGSNGKGSVCAMLARILKLHGYRAGLFTSPHLVCVEERIRIGDSRIGQRDFVRVLTDLRIRIEFLLQAKILISHPTYFETLVCAAFLYFQRKKVDIAVMEVGLGGRFDATNVVDPVVSIITTISAEHQKILGKKLDQIAFEKAGIIKPAVPVVSGVKAPTAAKTIQKRALYQKAPLRVVFEGKDCFQSKKREKDFLFEYISSKDSYCYSPSLPGEHQGKNAAIAIAAAEIISRRWRLLYKEKIIRAIESTRWEGRLEVLSRKPLVLLDGAHNEEGARALKRYLRAFVPGNLTIIYATMQDKKIEKIAEILFPLAQQIILTQFPYVRAAACHDIRKRVKRYANKIACEPDPGKAFRAALAGFKSDEALLVTGSLFLVGEIKKRIKTGELGKK